MKTRENVPKILNLCEIYDIPITWATVGHLFLSNCKRVNKIAHPEILDCLILKTYIGNTV